MQSLQKRHVIALEKIAEAKHRQAAADEKLAMHAKEYFAMLTKADPSQTSAEPPPLPKQSPEKSGKSPKKT